VGKPCRSTWGDAQRLGDSAVRLAVDNPEGETGSLLLIEGLEAARHREPVLDEPQPFVLGADSVEQRKRLVGTLAP
jgi:hypothetical protein